MTKENKEVKENNISREYVTIQIDREMFGIDVMRVREIIGVTDITHVPNTLPFMKGVIDLRGIVVPLVDMRIKFGLEERSFDKRTVFVIVETMGEFVGMIVDSVSDVVNIPDSSIQVSGHLNMNVDSRFIRGISRHDDKMVIVLDIDRILTGDELNSITGFDGDKDVSPETEEVEL